MMFTKEELREMRLADEEIEAGFRLTTEDLALSRRLDRQAELDQMDTKAAPGRERWERNEERRETRWRKSGLTR